MAIACTSPSLKAKRVVIGTADSVADSAVQGPFQDTMHIKLYNQGTKLLQQGRLNKALTLLDSAMESSDTTVGFRASFNDGWGNLVRGRRIQALVQAGGPAADSMLTAFEHDTALRRVTALDTAETDHVPASVITAPLSDEDKENLALDYAEAQLDSAVEKYRTALKLHPTDRDAKWNYELALAVINVSAKQQLKIQAQQGQQGQQKQDQNQKEGKNKRNKRGLRFRHVTNRPGPEAKNGKKKNGQNGKGNKPGKKANKGGNGQKGDKGGEPKKGAGRQAQFSKADKKDGEGGGGGNKQGRNGNGAGKGFDKDGPNGSPRGGQLDVEQMKLPPQQALQLLDAVGQHEQKPNSKTIQVPNAVPPRGKDW